MNSSSTFNIRSISPYGATLYDDGVAFAFASRSGTGGRVLFYDKPTDLKPSYVRRLDPEHDKFGDVWFAFVEGIQAGQLYHFQVDGPYNPRGGDYFDGKAALIDPYARALCGDFTKTPDGRVLPPKCVVVDDAFDWDGDVSLKRKLADEVIYELHVRGFTNSPSSAVSKPGSFLGLIEKIPYLKSLGVTAVELMPVHEFPRNAIDGTVPKIKNYWGYDPIAFFAPHRGYAWSDEPGAQVREFKETVKAFHQAGLEVYLDVVFNHTAEGDEKGGVFYLKGFENRHYYMTTHDGRYKNYSGCGNSVNGNHPWTIELIFNCLRSWVVNYHVDGFRFDLASILSRNQNGALVWNAPILELISEDPILAGIKMIAEAWDAGGAYQVGEFGTSRWAEWNGRYRDDVRRYWRGDDWTSGAFATRLGGSSDLYQKRGRKPTCSVNFATAHDGFTLNDLVSYNHKHNFANGEENRDGENQNISYNFGIEGETDDPKTLRLRARQIRNFFVSSLLSQGTPMITAGDEVKRTQHGNNNAYCQDSPLSWFDWRLVKKNADLFRFCSTLIKFRRNEAALRRRDFYTGQPQRPGGLPDVSWYDQRGGSVDWKAAQPGTLTCLISALDLKLDPAFSYEIEKAGAKTQESFPFDVFEEAAPDSNFHILAMFNPSSYPQTFYFPMAAKTTQTAWRLFVDSSADSPYDVYPDYDGPAPYVDEPILLLEKTTKVFVAPKSEIL